MNILSGPIIRPVKLLLYGVEGIGKSTLISELPKLGIRPLFLDTEAGTLDIDCKRVQISELDELEPTITDFLKLEQYGAFIIDTVTSLEPLVETAILKRTTKKRMADFEYGKGSVLLREEFDRLLLLQFDPIIRAGKHVIFIGHSQVQRTQLPELIEGFDRYELAMDKRVSATLRQWADHVLFCNWDYAVVENSRDEHRGVQGRGRCLHSVHSASFDAKNRAGLADKLDWKIESLAPLFVYNNLVISKNWATFVERFGGADPAGLFKFLQTRYPTFTPDNAGIVPDDYVRRALNRPNEFMDKVNEFLKPAKSETAQAEHASTVDS